MFFVISIVPSGGFYHTIHFIGFPKHEELLALLFGIQIAQVHSFILLTVVSNYLDIGHAANSTSLDFSKLAEILDRGSSNCFAAYLGCMLF